jgi:hypothetical protein
LLLNQVIANKKLSTNKKVVTTFKLYEKDALFGLNFSSAKGEATSTKTWKKRLILESSRELATPLI